jgi:hypothetical protein
VTHYSRWYKCITCGKIYHTASRDGRCECGRMNPRTRLNSFNHALPHAKCNAKTRRAVA